MKAQGASAETAVHIEYFLAVPPPTPAPPAPADDWVDALVAIPSSSSSSSNSSSELIVAAGCCDGGVRLWSRAALLAGAAPDARAEGRHPGGVDALAVAAGSSSSDDSQQLLLSSGRDGAARAFLLSSSSASNMAPAVVAELRGHADSVASVAACFPSTSASPSSYAATGCWDGSVKLWRLRGDPRVEAAIAAAAAAGNDDGSDGDAAAAKRRKVSKKQAPSSSSLSSTFATPDPLLTISNGGHTQCVSTLCWPSERCLLTGSWDHSVRRWEVEVSEAAASDAAANAADDDDDVAFPPASSSSTASCRPTDTLHAGHAVFALATPAGSDGRLVVLGGASSEVRLWDTRVAVPSSAAAAAAAATSSALLAASFRLGSHGDWVSALAWHPAKQHLVASAGHDGKVKLWDIRGGSGGGATRNAAPSPPLAVLAAHDGKALALAWCLGGGNGKKDLLVSGGADGRVRAFEVAA